jgi:hypothetical protein
LHETPPPELELTDGQYATLKEMLASSELPKQSCGEAELKAAGFSCWLECMMHRLALAIALD